LSVASFGVSGSTGAGAFSGTGFTAACPEPVSFEGVLNLGLPLGLSFLPGGSWADASSFLPHEFRNARLKQRADRIISWFFMDFSLVPFLRVMARKIPMDD
jgi:hypothetical protein